MHDLPAQMHPRYAAFVEFMADCPHRKTPETMQTAFWAWLNKSGNQSIIVVEQAKEITALKRDLNIKHREVAELQKQLSITSEEYECLHDELKRIKSTIAGFLNGGVIGERGDACLSIDGGNL